MGSSGTPFDGLIIAFALWIFFDVLKILGRGTAIIIGVLLVTQAATELVKTKGFIAADDDANVTPVHWLASRIVESVDQSVFLSGVRFGYSPLALVESATRPVISAVTTAALPEITIATVNAALPLPPPPPPTSIPATPPTPVIPTSPPEAMPTTTKIIIDPSAWVPYLTPYVTTYIESFSGYKMEL